MRRRTLILTAVGVVAAAAIVSLGVVLTSAASSADPNEAAVTELCRDAATDEPTMSEGVAEFAVSDLTHETEDGVVFYRAHGSAKTSDGFGGTASYGFTCDTKLVAERWELIDITLV